MFAPVFREDLIAAGRNRGYNAEGNCFMPFGIGPEMMEVICRNG